MKLAALVFDVDGTLADTEEVHRTAFNQAFAQLGLPWTWNEQLYAELLSVAGGKEPRDGLGAPASRRPVQCGRAVGRGDSEQLPACERKNIAHTVDFCLNILS